MECKKNPLVSIIIAAHNEDRYLDQCLISCIEQTYQNIEICVTDDGSTDNTLKLLKKYEGLDKRIKIFHHKQKLGIVAAFNSAFNLACGDYIAILCADDINDKKRISQSLELLSAYKADILSSCMLEFNNNGKILGISGYKKNSYDHFSLLNFFKNRGGFIGGSLFFTRNIGNKIYPLPENLHCTDQWIFALTYSHGWKHIHENFISAYYRFHDKNDHATPYMKFPNYKKRFIKGFSRRNIFYNTYLDYVKSRQLIPSEEIITYLKYIKKINSIIIYNRTHSKAKKLRNLFKLFSNNKDWLRALIIILDLSYITYMRSRIIHFITRYRGKPLKIKMQPHSNQYFLY